MPRPLRSSELKWDTRFYRECPFCGATYIEEKGETFLSLKFSCKCHVKHDWFGVGRRRNEHPPLPSRVTVEGGGR